MPSQKLVDTFGRVHDYLRISVIDKCNFRCTYCMPTEKMQFMHQSKLMTREEIFEITKTFVDFGITKIRITGGEPLVRKDIDLILKDLSTLPVSIHMTTNGLLLHEHLDTMVECGIKDLNISLDSLRPSKFQEITRNNKQDVVLNNITEALERGIKVKINMVVMKDVNENEIVDFVRLTKELPLSVRFIEFMPFAGNEWDIKKNFLLPDILQLLKNNFDETLINKETKKNGTTKNFQFEGFIGDFGVISTVSSPFCDGCNRIRLTADGKLKNCLFASDENDILKELRKGNDIKPTIIQNINAKKWSRGGMDSQTKFIEEGAKHDNRSMIAIGG